MTTGLLHVAGGLQGTYTIGPGGLLGRFDISKLFLKPTSRQTDLVFKRKEGTYCFVAERAGDKFLVLKREKVKI